jgi:copper chaperone
MQTLTFAVQGMTCQGCVANVTKVLTALAGVSLAVVSKEEAQATVTFDATQTTEAVLKAAVEAAGFDVA